MTRSRVVLLAKASSMSSEIGCFFVHSPDLTIISARLDIREENKTFAQVPAEFSDFLSYLFDALLPHDFWMNENRWTHRGKELVHLLEIAF